MTAAPGAGDDGGLREEIARWWASGHETTATDYRNADELLALSGIARLVADAARVKAVRELATQMLGRAERHHSEWTERGGSAGDADEDGALAEAYMDVYDRLRRALGDAS